MMKGIRSNSSNSDVCKSRHRCCHSYDEKKKRDKEWDEECYQQQYHNKTNDKEWDTKKKKKKE